MSYETKKNILRVIRIAVFLIASISLSFITMMAICGFSIGNASITEYSQVFGLIFFTPIYYSTLSVWFT